MQQYKNMGKKWKNYNFKIKNSTINYLILLFFIIFINNY